MRTPSRGAAEASLEAEPLREVTCTQTSYGHVERPVKLQAENTLASRSPRLRDAWRPHSSRGKQSPRCRAGTRIPASREPEGWAPLPRGPHDRVASFMAEPTPK